MAQVNLCAASRVAVTRYLTTKQASQLIGFSPKALEVMRYRGCGPPYFRIGRSVRYRQDDLVTWIEQASSGTGHNLRSPTLR
jgi:predicted DNA-binding transcriptional regulator AlpA